MDSHPVSEDDSLPPVEKFMLEGILHISESLGIKVDNPEPGLLSLNQKQLSSYVHILLARFMSDVKSVSSIFSSRDVRHTARILLAAIPLLAKNGETDPLIIGSERVAQLTYNYLNALRQVASEVKEEALAHETISEQG